MTNQKEVPLHEKIRKACKSVYGEGPGGVFRNGQPRNSEPALSMITNLGGLKKTLSPKFRPKRRAAGISPANCVDRFGRVTGK